METAITNQVILTPFTNKRPLLIILIVLITAFGCTKDNLPSPNDTPLTRVVYQDGDSIAYKVLKYDNNKLVMVIDSNNNGHIYTTIFTYDFLNKISSYIYKGDFPSSSYTASFNYSNGKIVRKNFSNPTGSYNNYYYTYQYDTKGRLISDSEVSKIASKVIDYEVFTYDQNDNVDKSQRFYLDNAGVFESTSIFTGKYDGQNNPLNNTDVNLFFVTEGDFLHCSLLSKNNIVVQTIDGNIYNYIYKYNNKGLPEKATIKFPGGEWVSQYFY